MYKEKENKLIESRSIYLKINNFFPQGNDPFKSRIFYYTRNHRFYEFYNANKHPELIEKKYFIYRDFNERFKTTEKFYLVSFYNICVEK